MPLRKQVQNLQDVCVESIARNIVIHGERLRKCRQQDESCLPYTMLQSHFGDNILKKLFIIFREEKNTEDKNLRELRKLVFLGCTSENLECWPCLELLFNHSTTSVPPFIDEMPRCRLPKYIFPYIASHCKNLQSVDIGSIGNTEVLEKIFEVCPLIENISADLCGSYRDGLRISDKFLFFLCKHHSQGEDFLFCPENGACSSMGKHLLSLCITLAYTSGAGIACALQHLPLLRNFTKLPFYDNLRYLFQSFIPDVLKGIVILQNFATSSGKPPVMLQLTDIYFYESLDIAKLRIVAQCCPKLESVQMNLQLINPQVFTILPNVSRMHFNTLQFDSTRNCRFLLLDPYEAVFGTREFGQFLSTQSEKIKALSFIFYNPRVFISLKHIDEILRVCTSLEELTLAFLPIQYHEGPPRLEIETPLSVENLPLEKMTLFVAGKYVGRLPFFTFLYDLVRSATNVKSLDLCYALAEKHLTKSMKFHDFSCLEEVRIRNSDIKKIPDIPLRSFAKATNNFRKLQFENCLYSDISLTWYREVAKMNNLELELIDLTL